MRSSERGDVEVMYPSWGGLRLNLVLARYREEGRGGFITIDIR